jgi:syntaxin-binding protein 1
MIAVWGKHLLRPRIRVSLTCSSLDKVRIIALYILFREGVADEDRRRLYQHARLSISEQDTINNLIYLGIRVIKVSQAYGNQRFS